MFDASLQQTYQSGTDAVNAGYYNHSDVLALLKLDPWFKNGRGTAYYSNMQADLQAASDVLKHGRRRNNGTKLGTKNLIQLVDWLMYCKPTNSDVTAAQADASWNSCSPNASCRSTTAEWSLYLNYYLQLKSKYYTIAKQLANPNCRDCFIGTDPLATPGCVMSGKLSDYDSFYSKPMIPIISTLDIRMALQPFAGELYLQLGFQAKFYRSDHTVRAGKCQWRATCRFWPNRSTCGPGYSAGAQLYL